MKPNIRQNTQAHLTAATGNIVRRATPFLKWAGGKTQLLNAFDQYIPAKFNSYYEPFVGGGAMFFHVHAGKPGLPAVLSDLNEELINCYRIVKDEVDALIQVLKTHRNESAYFYALRALDPKTMPHIERAARLIYLNKTCFNGLYRVNRRGQFNVPFGSYKNPRTCDTDNLRAVSAALQHVQLETQHFSAGLAGAGQGDFIYLDPPYQPLSATANFTSYTSKCFSESDQKQLAAVVAQLDKRGCLFMLSNSDNEFVRNLYHGLRIETVYATRAINCHGDKRGKISELLVMNY